MPPPDKFDWLAIGAMLLVILVVVIVVALFQLAVRTPAI